MLRTCWEAETPCQQLLDLIRSRQSRLEELTTAQERELLMGTVKSCSSDPQTPDSNALSAVIPLAATYTYYNLNAYHNCCKNYKLQGNGRRHALCLPIRGLLSQQADDTINWAVHCDWLQPGNWKFLYNIVHAQYYANEGCKTCASFTVVVIAFCWNCSWQIVSFNFDHTCDKGFIDSMPSVIFGIVWAVPTQDKCREKTITSPPPQT